MIAVCGTEMNTKDITFNENITRLINGSKHIGMGLKNKKLIIQTPFMMCPFGLSNNKYETDKYTIDLSFNDLDNDEQKKFYKNIKTLDKLIKNEILSRASILFNNKLSDTIIKNNYNGQLKKTKDYPPRLRIKLPYENNKFNFDIIDTDNNDISDLHKHINKGSMIRSVIECSGIWIINDSYSCVWKMKRMEIKTVKYQELDFIDDSDDE